MSARSDTLELGSARRGFEIVKGDDRFDLVSGRCFKNGAKRCRRAELNVDVSRRRQEFKEQCPASSCGKVVYSAFARMARGKDERSANLWDRAPHFIEAGNQAVEPQLEKVRRFSHPQRPPQVRAR